MLTLRTLPEALEEASRSDEGYIFVVEGAECRRPYAELQKNAWSVAASLLEAGLCRGDLVALALSDGEQFLTALLGASIAGLVPASLYPPVGTADLPRYIALTAGILRAAGARAVVTSAASVADFQALIPSCPDLSRVLAFEQLDAPPRAPARLPSLDDIAFVQFTSGSTSSPKGVALSHRNLSANIDAINGPCGLNTGPDDVGVSWLPLYHDMGLVGMALGPLFCARPGVLLTPQAFVRRPVEWLKAMSRHRGTISFAPNFAYDLTARRVKARDLEGLDLSPWRAAGCGAEPIHAPTLAAFAERLAPAGFRATSFLPSYGLAEHVLAATFATRDREPIVEHVSADLLTEQRIATPGGASDNAITLVSCGRALPGHEVRIAGEDGQWLRDRQVGEIALAGPSVMLGYYKDEALTAETIRDGWLYTGDLGYMSDGELFVCGRVKDIIIVNGRKYHPQDLEWAVADLMGTRRGRVVAFGTVEQGMADRVVIVAESGANGGSADELTEAIRRRISDLFGLYIADVVTVPSGTIGRTTSGKIQRGLTKARYEQGTLAEAGEGLTA